MLTLFVDANVIFSASLSKRGQARALFDLARDDYCVLLTSAYATEEARRNIGIKYAEHLSVFQDLLLRLTTVPEASPALLAWARTHIVAKDAPILAAAAASDASHLVTGDRRHFGHLYGQTLDRVTVVTLTEALKLVL